MMSKRWKFIPLTATVAAMVPMAAAACGGNYDEDTGSAQRAANKESGTPALTIDTPAPPASDPVSEEIETAARKLQADELGANESVRFGPP